MSSSRRLDVPPPEVIVRWVATVVGAALTILVTRNGVVVSPDSTFYLSAAESLADGDGLRTPTGDPLVLYPPGTSFVYAIGELLPLDALTWVRILNTVFAAGAISVTSLVVSRHVHSAAVAMSATIFTALSVGLLAVTRAAWSEPIFLVLGVLFVNSLANAVAEAVPSRRSLVVIAVIVWASFFTRYAGLALIPVGAVALSWIGPARSRRRAVEFVAMSAAVPLVWLVSNRLRHGSAVGDRPPSMDSLRDIVEEIAIVVGGWIVPPELLTDGGWLRAGIGIVVAMVLIATAVHGVRRRTSVDSEPADFRPANSEQADQRAIVASVAALTSLAGVVIVVFTQLRTAIDVADARLLSPALLPAIIAIAVTVDIGLSTSRRPRRVVWFVGVVVGVAVVATQAAAAFAVVRDAEPQRWTFTHPTWTGSEVIAALDGVDDATIWTNNPYAVWALTDHRRIAETPRSGEYRSDVSRPFPPLDELALACGATLLVWFERSGTFHFPVERIGEVVTLSDSRVLSDGQIHRVEPSAGCR